MATDDKAVAAIIDLIDTLEREAADAKRTLNRMLVRDGQPPRYSDAELNKDAAAGVGQIGGDRYFTKSLAPSIKDYLQLRKASNHGPASVDDIYDALVRGGFKFETDGAELRKSGLRQSLTKNTTMFRRLPHGDYGLVEWYPALKVEDEGGRGNKKKKKTRSVAKPAAPAPKVTPPKPADKAAQPAKNPPAATNGPITMLGAVRAGIAAMRDEFTKLDVLNWIVKNHPSLNAQDRKTSVDSMVAKLKDEMGLVVAFQGKGKEAHRFKRKDA